MKKYTCKLGSYLGLGAAIKEIECERQTDFFVWINGRRYSKRSEWINYFDSWEEAYAALLKVAERQIADARLELERANRVLLDIKRMSR